MRERVFITAGGSGHRLDVASEIPKALLRLPDGKMVIERQLRMLPNDLKVTICSGYRDDLMEKLFPNIAQLQTYDPRNPAGILSCIKDVLDLLYNDLDSFTFLLGDTIWHPDALEDALEHRHDMPIVYYGNRLRAPCETYMMTISGKGVKLMRELLTREKFITRAIRIPEFTVISGTIWLLDKWMDRAKGFRWKDRKLRMINSAPVDDFDTNEQWASVWQAFREGEYDAR